VNELETQIIMASHFPDHAFLASSKVTLMKQSEFMAMGMPDNVITDSNLEKVYNIKVKVVNVDTGVNRQQIKGYHPFRRRHE